MIDCGPGDRHGAPRLQGRDRRRDGAEPERSCEVVNRETTRKKGEDAPRERGTARGRERPERAAIAAQNRGYGPRHVHRYRHTARRHHHPAADLRALRQVAMASPTVQSVGRLRPHRPACANDVRGRPDGSLLDHMSLPRSRRPKVPKRNLAARAGHWSARHRKIAIGGWLAFVVDRVRARRRDRDQDARRRGHRQRRVARRRHRDQQGGLPGQGRRAGARPGPRRRRSPSMTPRSRPRVDDVVAALERREARRGRPVPARRRQRGPDLRGRPLRARHVHRSPATRRLDETSRRRRSPPPPRRRRRTPTCASSSSATPPPTRRSAPRSTTTSSARSSSASRSR